MAIDKHSKIQNVKASLEKYIADNLVTTEGLRVAFEGVPFESATEDEWIEERIESFGNTDFGRQVDTTRMGQTTQVMLSFNIFVNPDKTIKSNRHYELRDKVLNYFTIGTTINMYDFYNNNFSTVVQILKVRDILTDRAIQDDNFWRYEIVIGVDWLEKWT